MNETFRLYVSHKYPQTEHWDYGDWHDVLEEYNKRASNKATWQDVQSIIRTPAYNWYETDTIQQPRRNTMNDNNQRLILEAHTWRKGQLGIMCLAVSDAQTTRLDVQDGHVFCPCCGNTLGRADQLMIRVWLDRDTRTEAVLAFVG